MSQKIPCEQHKPYTCEEIAEILESISAKVAARVEKRYEGKDISTLERITMLRCEAWLAKASIASTLDSIQAGYTRKIDVDEFTALVMKSSEEAIHMSFKAGIHMAASYE